MNRFKNINRKLTNLILCNLKFIVKAEEVKNVDKLEFMVRIYGYKK